MLGLLVFLTSCLISISGHGYLLEPAARSSAWLVDSSFKDCCTYTNHMAMYCGGVQTQWNKNGGKCGICGEPYDTKDKLFEKGGAMYLGKIVKTYTQGQQIDVTVVITANHQGYFEFRLCNLDSNPDIDATQECLDQRLLTIADTNSTKFRDVGNYGSKAITIRVQLPQDIVCQHCVFQWKYTTGNNWGTDPVTGRSGIGMGVENETFMGCSDISIIGHGSSVTNTIPPIIVSTVTDTTNPITTTATVTAASSIITTATVTVASSITTTNFPTTSGLSTWSSNGVQYKKGDTVYYNGSKFLCVYDHVSFPGAQPSIITWALWQHTN